MHKTYAITFICLAFVLVGCTSQPLYVTKSGVSIYLKEEPVVAENSFTIKFSFESPTDDKHIIQQIETSEWTGIESFRTFSGKTTTDTHSMIGLLEDSRRMTLIPGEVADTDESLFSGFSMLPSAWPEYWNSKFRKDHVVRGYIVKMRPEFQTIYNLEFAQGKLVWTVEGTQLRREWSVPKQ